MIIIIGGGLGNQMFHYAFYRELQSRGRNVWCFSKDKYGLKATFHYKLDLFPNVRIQWADDATCRRIARWYIGQNIFEKIMDRCFTRRLFAYGEDLDQIVDQKLFSLSKNKIISGNFQNERYFQSVASQMREEFAFPPGEEKLQRFLEMLGDKSVSLHIRRGDYLKFSELYGEICTIEYYQKAVRYFEERLEAKFIVLSNDIEWVKANLNLKNAVYVEKEMFDCYDDWYDMCIMSHCHHNIIANSTFSWWGAWLNPHQDKIVISPPYNDNEHKTKRVACDDWIVIEP